MLLHGLTATRRYVVMGSRALERSGHRVLSYDARGHGRSSPAPSPEAYGYEHLAADLEAVLDELGIARAFLAGASMGAHTALRLALLRPERVAALGLITPSFDPSQGRTPEEFARWDALAQGLRQGGVEGFVRVYDPQEVPRRGVRRSGRFCASGCRPTSIPTLWRMRLKSSPGRARSRVDARYEAGHLHQDVPKGLSTTRG